MSLSDPNQPQTLLKVSSEIEAAAIVTALADFDIQAMAVGGFLSGFKIAAPGDAAVVVKAADLDRAKLALDEIRSR